MIRSMKAKRHPEEYTDTDPRAMKVWLELQRRMPADQKIAATLGASRLTLQAYEMGVRRLYPDASDSEVLRRVAARHLSPELLARVYGPEHECQPV
jgi:hypothetical protein